MKLAELLRFAGRKHFEGVAVKAIAADTKLVLRKVGDRFELHAVEAEAVAERNERKIIATSR